MTKAIASKIRWSFPALIDYMRLRGATLTHLLVRDWLAECVSSNKSLNICQAALTAADYLASTHAKEGILERGPSKKLLKKLTKRYAAKNKES